MKKYISPAAVLICLVLTACQKELTNNAGSSLSASTPASGGGPTGPLPVLATWNTLQDLPFNGWNASNPTIGDEGPLGFSINGKGYVCSGYGVPGDCWQYDATNDTWTQKANLPVSGVAGKGLNGTVSNGHHFGFIISSGVNGCLQYDPSTDQWATLPTMPGGDRREFAAFMAGRCIVVGGGLNGTTSTPRMDVRQLRWNQ